MGGTRDNPPVCSCCPTERNHWAADLFEDHKIIAPIRRGQLLTSPLDPGDFLPRA